MLHEARRLAALYLLSLRPSRRAKHAGSYRRLSRFMLSAPKVTIYISSGDTPAKYRNLSFQDMIIKLPDGIGLVLSL